MRVQRVLMPNPDLESWAVLGDDGPIEPVDRYLAYLTAIERSRTPSRATPTTSGTGSPTSPARAGLAGGHAGGHRRVRGLAPPAARGPRDGTVAVLPSVVHHCTERSVNRKLSALAPFCEFHARHGVDLGELLITMRPAGRRGGASWKPFLHHVTKHLPQRRRTIKLTEPKPLPEVLTARQVQAILDACEHLRDRLLFATLLDTGVRIGEALGLRHEDLAIAERELTVTPRVNDNRRYRRPAVASAGLCRSPAGLERPKDTGRPHAVADDGRGGTSS